MTLIDVDSKTEDFREISLPYGWKKVGQKRRRSSRSSNGENWDFHLISPSGKRFRSSVEVKNYLDKNPEIKCDRTVTNIIPPLDLQFSTDKSRRNVFIGGCGGPGVAKNVEKVFAREA